MTFQSYINLDGLDLEVQSDQWKNQTLEILDQIVETPQAIGVLAGVHINLEKVNNFKVKYGFVRKSISQIWAS